MQENKKTVRITDKSYQMLEDRDREQFPSVGAYASYLVEIATQHLNDRTKETRDDPSVSLELLREVQAIRKGQEKLEKEIKRLYQLLDRRLGFANEELFNLFDPSKG